MCKVLLNSIEKVKEFVQITSRFETDVLLKAGKYTVDGKSILGIFSLDLTEPIELQFDSEKRCDESIISEYTDQIRGFLS